MLHFLGSFEFLCFPIFDMTFNLFRIQMKKFTDLRCARQKTECSLFLPSVLKYLECLNITRTFNSYFTNSFSSLSDSMSTSVTRKIKTLKQESKKPLEELELSLKEKSTKKNSFVFKQHLAKKLVSNILDNRGNPNAPILEISPGVGIVSREFLNQGVNRVIALETEKVFQPYLKQVQEEYGEDRFQFYPWNILNIYEKFDASPPKIGVYSYKDTEDLVVKALSKSTSVETGAAYSIFTLGGGQENHNLIFYILRNLPTEDPVLSKGRVDFFFLVHPKFKISVEGILPTSKPSKYSRYYSYFHTFIPLLYDISFIAEFEASDFVPAFSKNGSTKKINARLRHLFKMQLKENMPNILPLDQHYPFSIFLRHIFRKRKIRIIPVMETLVAGSGLRMLTDGFTMIETVSDVSPQRLLHLYKSMLHWPEYSVSHLKNHIVMKTQGGPIDDEDL